MNKNISDLNEIQSDEGSFDLIKEFFKYFFFWKYFLISLIVCLSIAYISNRYMEKLYATTAKIQILDKNQNNLEMPTAEDLFSSSKINLENEMEIIKSSSIFEEVIENLNLNLSVEAVGDVVSSRVLKYPFKIEMKSSIDTSSTFSFNIKIDDNVLDIVNLENGKKYVFNGLYTNGIKHDLPFDITNVNKEKWLVNGYNVIFVSTNSLIQKLKKDISVYQVGKSSDIISLTFNNSNSRYARNVLNEIVEVFNNDGVRDRQLIHKRTIDFVNDRYKYLATELESIELEKKSYKVSNNLVDLAASSTFSLERNVMSEQNLFSNENQIFLVSNLLNELSSLDVKLLPANIGIENLEVNSLIASYNDLFLEKQKLSTSAGPNNPFVKQLNNSLNELRNNIVFSLNTYLSQLNLLKNKLIDKSKLIKSNADNIPLLEKNLRSIERNQQIKEALYLFLLQKGEEAQVSFAVTEPSIKVVESAISNKIPISPKPKIIYLTSIIIGLLIPFVIIICLSRVYLGVHYITDVIGGIILGFSIAVIVYYLLKKIIKC